MHAGIWVCGTAYKVDTTGEETVLYNFCSVAKCADGSYPDVGLVEDAAGNLYGTTPVGGKQVHYGTVLRVDPHGNETVLYNFPGHDLQQVYASALVLDAAGNLYGTTLFDGAFRQGSVFEVPNSGRTRLLHSFNGGTDGGAPYGLLLDAAGILYGTTGAGGELGSGTLYELTP